MPPQHLNDFCIEETVTKAQSPPSVHWLWLPGMHWTQKAAFISLNQLQATHRESACQCTKKKNSFQKQSIAIFSHIQYLVIFYLSIKGNLYLLNIQNLRMEEQQKAPENIGFRNETAWNDGQGCTSALSVANRFHDHQNVTYAEKLKFPFLLLTLMAFLWIFLGYSLVNRCSYEASIRE
jgi:hypothetical protein